jgi:hypothetical protein
MVATLLSGPDWHDAAVDASEEHFQDIFPKHKACSYLDWESWEGWEGGRRERWQGWKGWDGGERWEGRRVVVGWWWGAGGGG